MDGFTRETVLSPALTTQIASRLDATAIGSVPTATDAKTAPDPSSTLTLLAGSVAAAAGASHGWGIVAPPKSRATIAIVMARAAAPGRSDGPRAEE